LRLDGGAELLDLLVDLANPLRVVLYRLDALGREGREHDVGGHSSSSGWGSRRRGRGPVLPAPEAGWIIEAWGEWTGHAESGDTWWLPRRRLRSPPGWRAPPPPRR